MMRDTRAEWLTSAVYLLRPIFELRAGLTVPQVRVGMAHLGRPQGIAWPREVVSDRTPEVSISLRHSPDRPWEILGTLAHELIHVCGISGHRKPFADAAKAIGLHGRPKSAGLDGDYDRVPEHLRKVLDELGAFPGGQLKVGTTRKKQTTRLHKVLCMGCGMTARMTTKWIIACSGNGTRELRCIDQNCSGEVMIVVKTKRKVSNAESDTVQHA